MKSAILKFANLVGETGIYRLLCQRRIPVFILHRVTDGSDDTPGDMTAHRLRGYLRYLSTRGYQVLTMGQLWQILHEGRAIPSKSVMFTIDDGFSDHHDVAASVFDEFGFALNFFVITGLLDRQLWPWDDQIAYALNSTKVTKTQLRLPSGETYAVNLKETSVKQTIRKLRNALKTGPQEQLYQWLGEELYDSLGVACPETIPPEYRPMSWKDARSLQARGHGVYPHTCSHRILSALSLEDKRQEINDARLRVEIELGASPEVFAYPTGRPSDYDSADIEELKKAGFKMAFNTVPDYVRFGNDHYELPRFSLPENTPDFLQIVNRFEALKKKFQGHPGAPRNFLPIR